MLCCSISVVLYFAARAAVFSLVAFMCLYLCCQNCRTQVVLTTEDSADPTYFACDDWLESPASGAPVSRDLLPQTRSVKHDKRTCVTSTLAPILLPKTTVHPLYKPPALSPARRLLCAERMCSGRSAQTAQF